MSFQGFRFSIEIVQMNREIWTFFIRNDTQVTITSLDVRYQDTSGSHTETEPYRLAPGKKQGGWAMFTADSRPLGFRIVSVSYIGSDGKTHTLNDG